MAHPSGVKRPQPDWLKRELKSMGEPVKDAPPPPVAPPSEPPVSKEAD